MRSWFWLYLWVAIAALPAVALAQEKASETALDSSTDDIQYRVIGFLRLEGAAIQDDPNVAFVGRNDGFRLQNARIGLDGTWKERVTLRISADGAVDERDDPNAVEGRLRLALRDAYADAHFGHKIDLRIARFKARYDIEELTSTADMPFIDRALSSRGTRATEGFESRGLGVQRNLGIALRSEGFASVASMRFDFELAAQNGNGDLDAANDNNALAYSASVAGRFGAHSMVLLGARHNSRTEGELPFRRAEDDLGGVVAVRYWRSPLRLTAQGIYQRTTFGTTGGPSQNSYGVHAEGLAQMPTLTWLEVGYRYALLEPSDLIPSDQVQEHTVGVNIKVRDYRLDVQINATHTVEETGRVLSNDRLEALVQVAL